MMIELRNLKKTYPNGYTVLEHFHLEIEDGSFTVLVGPSGCGKTTLLRMIAGLEDCTQGEILVGGKNITHLPPGDRGIAMVFQNYALYPHMTVEKNVLFGLRNFGYGKAEAQKICGEVLALVGLEEYAKTKPGNLSGGQRQRVALARAISKSPEVFLMDEPLSNLDAPLRVQMRSELIRIHRKLGSTFLYITHDQVEAMTMGDYIAVLNEGKVMQYGRPEEVYRNPANVFAARFIGDPGMNIVDHGSGKLGFRASKVLFAQPEHFAGLALDAKILTREHLGEIFHYTAQTAAGQGLEIRHDRRLEVDEPLCIYLRREDLFAFDEAGERTALEQVFREAAP